MDWLKTSCHNANYWATGQCEIMANVTQQIALSCCLAAFLWSWVKCINRLLNFFSSWALGRQCWRWLVHFPRDVGWIGIEKKPYIISCHYENENICGRRFEDIRTRSRLVEWNPWLIWSQPPIDISYCQMTAFVFAQWLNAFENSNASIVDRDSSIRSHFAVVLFNEP